MPNHSHLIKNYSLVRYTRSANAIDQLIAKCDADLRAMDRRADLYDHERAQRKYDIEQTARAAIAQHRRDMDEALADHRSWSATHTDDLPSAEESARRMYFSTRAQAELANLSPADALMLIERVVATGDKERGQEYVAAARGRVPVAKLIAAERAVESVDTSGARYWGATVDELSRQLGWLDQHIEALMAGVGKATEDVRRDPATGAPIPWPGDRAPEAPLDTRRIGLWVSALNERAEGAFATAKAEEVAWSEVAAALPNAGSGGWDASGDEAPAADGADQ